MARRQQRRRPAFRPPRGVNRDDTAEQSAIEAGARRLLNAGGHDPRSLRSLVGDLRLLREEADKRAYEDPSPDALQQFRRATRELAEAERALDLMGDDVSSA